MQILYKFFEIFFENLLSNFLLNVPPPNRNPGDAPDVLYLVYLLLLFVTVFDKNCTNIVVPIYKCWSRARRARDGNKIEARQQRSRGGDETKRSRDETIWAELSAMNVKGKREPEIDESAPILYGASTHKYSQRMRGNTSNLYSPPPFPPQHPPKFVITPPKIFGV